jgi:hypothetical protein
MIENWFPTSIYYYDNIENTQEIFKELNQAEEKIESFFEENCWNDNVSTTFNAFDNVIVKYNLTKFNKLIHTHVINYIEELKIIPRKFYLKESWFNKIKKHGYQDKHLHGPNIISGCYYFEDSNFEEEGIHFYLDNFFGSTKTIYYPFVNNRLILFPGLLEHSVKYKKTEGIRKSISFNFNLQY